MRYLFHPSGGKTMEIPRDCVEGKGMETIVRSNLKGFGQWFQPSEGFPLCALGLWVKPPRMGQRVFDSFLPYKKECLVPARDGKVVRWEKSTYCREKTSISLQNSSFKKHSCR